MAPQADGKQQQVQPASSRSRSSSGAQTLGFANEAQYLLVNQASVDYVAAQVDGGQDTAATAAAAVDALRFRPNLVVSGFMPWAEDSWSGVEFRAAEAAASNCHHSMSQPTASQQQHEQQQLEICPVPPAVQLQVVGPCGRCDMVSIDQSTGQRQGNQLLSLLARERRVGGKLQFGVLLGSVSGVQQQQKQQGAASQAVWLRVGDAVLPS
jgi:uncharacterized protein YcbX